MNSCCASNDECPSDLCCSQEYKICSIQLSDQKSLHKCIGYEQENAGLGSQCAEDGLGNFICRFFTVPGSWQFNLFIVLVTYKLVICCAGLCNIAFTRQSSRRFVDRDVRLQENRMIEIVDQARIDASRFHAAEDTNNIPIEPFEELSDEEQRQYKKQKKRRRHRRPIVGSPATSD